VAGWVFRHASAITACSPELRDAAISLGAADKVRLVAWGADPEIFYPLKQSKDLLSGLGLNEDQFIISTLGRLVYKKGFDRLIDAWKIISRLAPNARLLIGGDGPLREGLIAKSNNLGLADRIVFAGNIKWDQVPEFLSSSDLFILPSIRDEYGNIDGLPTVLLEAMACGKPVIASQLGGIPLVITHNQNGKLVPPGDIDALSQSILDLINQEDMRLALGKQARIDIVNKYNWMNVSKVFIELFEMALWRKNIKTRMGSIYRDEMLRLMDLKPGGGRVLDVGCHDGLFLSDLNAALKIGLDPDPVRGIPNISLIQGDGCQLPFSNGKFDHVYALDVIEHVEDDSNFARSLMRVLSPEGRLLITTPSQDIRIFPPFTQSYVNKKWGHTLRTGYTSANLVRLFSNPNFTLKISEWSAPAYRFFYFPMRALFAILPGLTQGIIRALALWDFKHRNGTLGFYILEAFRIAESSN
jgi:ubiquinone/menaquinone biosynthesis C-methylase UbiE